MKIDRIALSEADNGRRLSARVRPAGAEEFELWFEVPPPFGGDDLDATPLLLALLPRALASEQTLELDGCVSPRLLGSLEDVMRVYASFYPDTMRPIDVRADSAVPRPGPPTTTCFFSRGVDSWYSVLAERREPSAPLLTHLAYVRGIDVNYDERQERLALEAVRDATTLAGLELVVCTTNLRRHTDPVLDWNPCHGAGLAAVGLALRPSRSLTPSAYGFGELMPAGSHVVLDHRFSTENTRIEVHGEATRAEKVARLADWPEAVSNLRVCFLGNVPHNCGDCSKCIHTMLELHVAGIKPRDAGFDRPLTPARVASVSLHPAGVGRYRETLAKLRARPEDAELAEAFVLATLRGQTTATAEALAQHEQAPYPEAAARVAAAVDLMDGEALAPPPGMVRNGAVGLIRALDRRRRRHVYSFGSAPASADLVGELGSLEAFRQEDSVAVWLGRDGQVTTERHAAQGLPRPAAAARLRFLVAPLAWKGDWGWRARLGAVRDRARMLRRPGAGPPRAPRADDPVPVGYLHADDGPSRRPLFSAFHPVTGDQLLTGSPLEASDMGYGQAELLGYLLDRAPVTGHVGVLHRPQVPWASRFGLSARAD